MKGLASAVARIVFLLPVDSQSTDWLDSPAHTGSPPVWPTCSLRQRRTARTLEGRNSPGPLASPSNVQPNGVFLRDSRRSLQSTSVWQDYNTSVSVLNSYAFMSTSFFPLPINNASRVRIAIAER